MNCVQTLDIFTNIAPVIFMFTIFTTLYISQYPLY